MGRVDNGIQAWQVDAFSSRVGQRGEHGTACRGEGSGGDCWPWGPRSHRTASPGDPRVRGSLRARAKVPQKEGSDQGRAGRREEGSDTERKVVGLRGRLSDGLQFTDYGARAKPPSHPGPCTKLSRSTSVCAHKQMAWACFCLPDAGVTICTQTAKPKIFSI